MGRFIKSLIEAGKVAGYWDFRTGSLRDLSGNGNDATVVGAANMRWTSCRGAGVRSQLLAALMIPHNVSLSLSTLTIAWMGDISDDIGSNRLIRKGNEYDLYIASAADRLVLSSNGLADYDLGSGGEWLHTRSLAVTWEGGSTPRAFRNAALLGDMDAALPYDGAGSEDLYLLNYSELIAARFFKGCANTILLCNEALSDADAVRVLQELETGSAPVRRQVRKFLDMGDRTPVIDGRVHSDGSCGVTLFNLGAGNEIANGWRIAGGTWKVTDDAMVIVPDAGRRQIVWVATNDVSVYKPANSAYGSWYSEVVLNAADDQFWLSIASQIPNSYSQGYSLNYNGTTLRLMRDAATVIDSFAVVLTTDPVWFWISRSASDDFIVWALGGGTWTNWTQVLSGNDATYSTSKYVAFNTSDAIKFRGLVQYQGDMNPFEAMANGILRSDLPTTAPLAFTSDGSAQSWVINMDTGETAVLEWGDGEYDWVTGTGGNQTITHTYAAPAAYDLKLWMYDKTACTYLDFGGNGLSGSLPDPSELTAVRTYYADNNGFTGTLPSFAACAELRYFSVYNCSFTGTLPSFNACTNLINFYIGSNGFTGTLPSFAACTNLAYFSVSNNSFAGAFPAFGGAALIDCYIYLNSFTGELPDLSAHTSIVNFSAYSNAFSTRASSVVAATCTQWRADANALVQAAVDAVLADFATGVAGRPAVGLIEVDGGTNAAPSAAGLTSKGTILAAKPGWTINNN